MANDEEPKTASMVAIMARLKRGTADNEKLIAYSTVVEELNHFATHSRETSVWTLRHNVRLPKEEEIEINEYDLPDLSSLYLANSGRRISVKDNTSVCNFTIYFFSCNFY